MSKINVNALSGSLLSSYVKTLVKFGTNPLIVAFPGVWLDMCVHVCNIRKCVHEPSWTHIPLSLTLGCYASEAYCPQSTPPHPAFLAPLGNCKFGNLGALPGPQEAGYVEQPMALSLPCVGVYVHGYIRVCVHVGARSQPRYHSSGTVYAGFGA